MESKAPASNCGRLRRRNMFLEFKESTPAVAELLIIISRCATEALQLYPRLRLEQQKLLKLWGCGGAAHSRETGARRPITLLLSAVKRGGARAEAENTS
eukprot:409083-Pleurochrysis_carterae.AAC.1